MRSASGHEADPGEERVMAASHPNAAISDTFTVPPSVNAIIVGQRTGKTEAGDFIYHLVRLDWVQRFAPRWRLTIRADLSTWQVVREQ
jgi:hypothetical protein